MEDAQAIFAAGARSISLQYSIWRLSKFAKEYSIHSASLVGALSRNRRVGCEPGRGRKLDEIIGETREVAEGVKTASSARQLAARIGVEMPITKGVYQMLYEGKSPRDLEIELMERPLKRE